MEKGSSENKNMRKPWNQYLNTLATVAFFTAVNQILGGFDYSMSFDWRFCIIALIWEEILRLEYQARFIVGIS